MKNILEINNLEIDIEKKTLINKINFSLYENEIIGIVGESGSGKSITSQAILRLLDPKVFNVKGSIIFQNKNLLTLKEKEMCSIRGNRISMIYQDPLMAMNPLMKIRKQIEECLKIHGHYNKIERKEKIYLILEKVRLNNLDDILERYPYELSGGQLQRVMIAMALITEPDILIADEPTTSLDVTIQKEIVLLIKELSNDMNMSVIFISHDLGLIAEICSRVIVMYKGNILEDTEVVDFFNNPKTEYAKDLLYARPGFLYEENDLC